MCAVADGEVVIARIEDVALRAVGVIGREEVAGHIDRDSLGCTCGVDFVIAQQLDRGLFDVVLLVVVSVGVCAYNSTVALPSLSPVLLTVTVAVKVSVSLL